MKNKTSKPIYYHTKINLFTYIKNKYLFLIKLKILKNCQSFLKTYRT